MPAFLPTGFKKEKKDFFQESTSRSYLVLFKDGVNICI